MNDRQLEIAFNKCKIAAMSQRNNVFLTTIAFSLKIEFTKNVPTAGVDGTTMWINPDFFKGMKDNHRLTVYLHEVYHVVFQDMLTLGTKDPQLWNMATDYHHNLLLKDNGYELPPGEWCLDEKYRHMSSHQIYDKLVQKNTQVPKDYPMDIVYVDQFDKEKEAEIVNTVIRGMTQSRMSGDKAGTIPGEVARAMTDLLEPVMPWQDLLMRFMTERTKEDYTYQRRNRRFPDIILPSQYSESMESLAIAIDSSGSVTDEQFTEFLTEITYIQDVLKPKKLTILDFDTKIKNVHEIAEGDSIIDLKFRGYGGTRIGPVIKWIEDNNPVAMLIFTDGYFNAKPYKGSTDIIWVINGNDNYECNYGEIIHFG